MYMHVCVCERESEREEREREKERDKKKRGCKYYPIHDSKDMVKHLKSLESMAGLKRQGRTETETLVSTSL